MNNPWTPGRWWADMGDAGFKTLVRAETYGDGDRKIADTFVQIRKKMAPETYNKRIAQNEANARLIAAAPEMAELLEQTMIGIGMGWDLDGYLLQIKKLLARIRGDAT